MDNIEVLHNAYFFEIFIFLIGLCFGSFANVVIYRLPEGKSVVKPRSSCPKCSKMIAWFDNIPVLSWVILGGKCRGCKTKISFRYPLVELVMGGLFLAVYMKYGFSYTTIEYLIFVFALVTACVIDIDHMILPDAFTLSGIAIALVGASLNPEREFWTALFGMLAGGGFLWLIAWIYWVLRNEEGMGGGDIKLLAWIGALLGLKAVPFVILSSSLIGSVIGLTLIGLSRGNMKTAIPFGPYLGLGALLYIFGGQTLGQLYLDLFIPSLSQ